MPLHSGDTEEQAARDTARRSTNLARAPTKDLTAPRSSNAFLGCASAAVPSSPWTPTLSEHLRRHKTLAEGGSIGQAPWGTVLCFRLLGVPGDSPFWGPCSEGLLLGIQSQDLGNEIFVVLKSAGLEANGVLTPIFVGLSLLGG